ncbi:MAG: bifunctional 4-hydroxy-2-oxoglutarate aldolase/2-dehydro-3-deoxy-phosphogluconate aldolase [Oligosphaeraceae bacterium]
MSFRALSQALTEKLSRVRIIPVLSFHDSEEALRLGEILVSGGLCAAEVTFRTEAAEGAIRAMRKAYPQLCLGAGTVLSVEQLSRAIDAGAEFAVAPGLNPEVVRAAVEREFAFAPGVCTPSEIELAYSLGCVTMKFFPAEAAGGLTLLKAMSAPYKHLGIRFMPTGGVTTANAAAYLSVKEVVAVGGTWLAKADDMAAGKWDVIRQNVTDAANLIRSLEK